ncbi:cytochrome P450 4C1-like isoform X2 [Periplaneta americana]|uniref:cytochrome P450 4C1-like isoform X2 n=1 Tax=Periplaneta americana TaxID=6978 RepID=UPI0037E8E10B
MEPTTLLLVAVIILVLLIIWPRDPQKKRIKNMMDKFPGPPSYPILGSALPYIFAKPEEYLDICVTLMTKYKPVMKFWLGPIPVVAISSPDYVETVLSNTKMIEKSVVYSLLHPWLGTGLLTSTESAMGTSVNAQQFEDSEYVTAVYRMKEIVMKRIAKPYLLSDFIFNLTKWGKLQKSSLKVIHGFTKKVIKERKEQRVNGNQYSCTDDDIYFGEKRRIAFLDMLLEAAEKGEKLSEKDIQEEVDTFMFEGHDTITAAINCCLFLLGLHPDVQDKVYDELKDIFKDSDRSPNLKDLQDMRYLQMVIKESLRMYPSVPQMGRQAPYDFELGSYKIPAGATVYLLLLVSHFDPDIFPNPTKFNPDNFLPENVAGRHPYAYFPFSAGPRNCIGQKFAMLEMKMVLSSILRSYEVRSVDKMEDLVLMLEIIIRSKYGFRISINPRKS